MGRLLFSVDPPHCQMHFYSVVLILVRPARLKLSVQVPYKTSMSFFGFKGLTHCSLSFQFAPNLNYLKYLKIHNHSFFYCIYSALFKCQNWFCSFTFGCFPTGWCIMGKSNFSRMLCIKSAFTCNGHIDLFVFSLNSTENDVTNFSTNLKS